MIDQNIDALLIQAEKDGISVPVLMAQLRRRRWELEAEKEGQSVPPSYGTLSATRWSKVKAFVTGPVTGEARLGKVLTSISDAIADDDQAAFWTNTLLMVRELRRHLHIKDQVFGKKEG